MSSPVACIHNLNDIQVGKEKMSSFLSFLLPVLDLSTLVQSHPHGTDYIRPNESVIMQFQAATNTDVGRLDERGA